jgi:hypothetical protein
MAADSCWPDVCFCLLHPAGHSAGLLRWASWLITGLLLLLLLLIACSYFLSLGLAPTAVIGLDSQLRAPKVELACNARPSLFAYPPPVTTETSKEVRFFVFDVFL